MFKSRRFILGCLGIVSCVIIAIVKDVDTSLSVAAIVATVAGANAYQKKGSGVKDEF